MMRHASMTDSLLAPVCVGRYADLAIRDGVMRELRTDRSSTSSAAAS